MSMQYAGSETLVVNEETPPGSVPLVRPEVIINVDELSYQAAAKKWMLDNKPTWMSWLEVCEDD